MGVKTLVKKIVETPIQTTYSDACKAQYVSYETYLKKKGCLVRLLEAGKTIQSIKRPVLIGRGGEVLDDLVYGSLIGHPLLVKGEEALGTLSPLERSIASLIAYLILHPEKQMVYGDEASSLGSWETSPWFKPDWSPDRFLFENEEILAGRRQAPDYMGKIIAIRKEVYDAAVEARLQVGDSAKSTREYLISYCGGFSAVKNPEEGSPIGHLTELCDFSSVPLENSEDNAENIPYIDLSNTERASQGAADISLSVIIPSKDHFDILSVCLNSILPACQKVGAEVIVVDNGSSSECRAKIEEFLNLYPVSHTYLYEPQEFHFSRMCNMGAKAARGDQLLFLNDDIEAVTDGWMLELSHLAGRPWVGAVGMKLLYPDGQTIQHCGITNLPSGPVHRLQFLKDDKSYYDGCNQGCRNVLAVTGACLLLRKSLFEEAGGFPEELAVAFNDVDLCFCLHEMGYYNVVCLEDHLLHHESLSRGSDTTKEKLERLNREYCTLSQRHYKKLVGDPFYNPWLSQSALSTEVEPAKGRVLQEEKIEQVSLPMLLDQREWEAYVAGKGSHIREDACLYSKLLYGSSRELHGFVMLLGSDNSLWNKEILLRSKEGGIYRIPFTPAYTQMAELNPEENAALSAFHIKLASPLPAGEYTFGAYTRQKLGRSRIYCFTEQTITVKEV